MCARIGHGARAVLPGVATGPVSASSRPTRPPAPAMPVYGQLLPNGPLPDDPDLGDGDSGGDAQAWHGHGWNPDLHDTRAWSPSQADPR